MVPGVRGSVSGFDGDQVRIRATGSEMNILAFGVLRFHVDVLDVQDGELGVSGRKHWRVEGSAFGSMSVHSVFRVGDHGVP